MIAVFLKNSKRNPANPTGGLFSWLRIISSIHFCISFSSYQFPGCDNVGLVGNGVCNDETNIAGCNYDGGDCCGPDVSCK